jgi:hypothetical protein
MQYVIIFQTSDLSHFSVFGVDLRFVAQVTESLLGYLCQRFPNDTEGNQRLKGILMPVIAATNNEVLNLFYMNAGLADFVSQDSIFTASRSIASFNKLVTCDLTAIHDTYLPAWNFHN